MRPRIIVVTHSPSPYQIELFDELATMSEISLGAIYLYNSDPSRSWTKRQPNHDHWVFDGVNGRELQNVADRSDLLAVNYYRHPFARKLIRGRVRNFSPWVFWGERPGFLNPLLGRLARRWLLRDLHRSVAPIWGIGEFALDAYRREFGTGRCYVNIPYFSNLERFGQIYRVTDELNRVILFSGSLIPRKGVEELAHAFVEVAPQFPGLRLQLMGSGPLECQLRSLLTPVIGQVEFLGFCDWGELPAAYASADVLCVPSRHDGWGLVVPEGLAAGLPVIATTRMGAALDLIRDGENGWLVPPGNVKSLAGTLERAAKLDALTLGQLSARARTAVAAHSLRAGTNRFVAACRAALDQSG